MLEPHILILVAWPCLLDYLVQGLSGVEHVLSWRESGRVGESVCGLFACVTCFKLYLHTLPYLVCMARLVGMQFWKVPLSCLHGKAWNAILEGTSILSAW